MNDSSGSSAILGVIVGVVIVGAVVFFWMNGTFSGGNNSVDVNVPAPTINVTPPAAPPSITVTPPANPAPAPAPAPNP